MNRLLSAVLVTALLGTGLNQAQAGSDEISPKDKRGSYWDRFHFYQNSASKKPFYFRAGITSLQPDSSSDDVWLDVPVDSATSLALSSGPIAGSGASVSSVSFPSVTVGYRLPWLDGHLALETVLALPFTVELKAEGTLASNSIAPYGLNNIPTGVPPLGSEFGETKVLPPLVTLVYRFALDQPLRPYVGAGLSYMITYDSRVTNPVLTAVGEPELEIDNVFGFAVQGGVEYQFYKDWWVNFDVKYITGLETEARVKGIWVETPDLPTFSPVEVGDATVKVSVDPWIYQLGVGFDF